MEKIQWFALTALLGTLSFLQKPVTHSLPPLPQLDQIQLQPEEAVQDALGILMGLRRMMADIAFIELLEYYGTHEELEPEPGHSHHYEGGHYPKLLSKTFRILQLDPYFHYACLYSAGSLIFNLNRPEEGILLLQKGLEWDPNHWPYRLILAALAYKRWEDFRGLVSVLERAATYPDCPPLFKNILANLYKKQGQVKKAIQIYLRMLESKDLAYVEHAQRELKKLSK